MAYTPFGNIDRSGSSGQDVFRPKFAGKEWESSAGAYYFGARYYDPKVGAFLSPAAARQYFSGYTYAGNHPRSRIGSRISTYSARSRSSRAHGQPAHRVPGLDLRAVPRPRLRLGSRPGDRSRLRHRHREQGLRPLLLHVRRGAGDSARARAAARPRVRAARHPTARRAPRHRSRAPRARLERRHPHRVRRRGFLVAPLVGRSGALLLGAAALLLAVYVAPLPYPEP